MHKTMFGLLYLQLFEEGLMTYWCCLCIVVSNTYYVVLCFWFVCLSLVYPMLSVSLDCPFWLPLRYSPMFIYGTCNCIPARTHTCTLRFYLDFFLNCYRMFTEGWSATSYPFQKLKSSGFLFSEFLVLPR